MLRGTFFLILLALFFWSSCSESKVHHSELSKSVSDFLKQLKQKELPIVIKGCKSESLDVTEYSTDKFVWLDTADARLGMYPYCTFSSNGDYVSVIYLGLAACTLPYLITYTPDGKKIDEGFLGIGGCGAGPGFECEEYMTIRQDYSVYTSDTIISADVDSLGHNIKSSEKHYVVYKEGKILPNGKVQVSEEITKNLR